MQRSDLHSGDERNSILGTCVSQKKYYCHGMLGEGGLETGGNHWDTEHSREEPSYSSMTAILLSKCSLTDLQDHGAQWSSMPRNYSVMHPPHTHTHKAVGSPLPRCPALPLATPWERDSKASPGMGNDQYTTISPMTPFGMENLGLRGLQWCALQSSPSSSDLPVLTEGEKGKCMNSTKKEDDVFIHISSTPNWEVGHDFRPQWPFPRFLPFSLPYWIH